MANMKQVLVFLSSLLVCLYVLYVLGSVMLFLSAPRKVPLTYSWIFKLMDNDSRWDIVFGPLFTNTLYLLAFILQHSVMKSELVKKAIQFIGLAAVERSIYNLTSALSLNHLVQHWVPAQSVILWQVNVEENATLWWMFTLVHAFAWFVVLGGSIAMDAPELLGIKQPYNDIQRPMMYGQAKVSHPSFSSLCVILWATNLMSLDRLLLAEMLTAYMYVAWSTDRSDVAWHKYQLQRNLRGWKTH